MTRSHCPYCRSSGHYHPRGMEYSGYWAYECGNEWLDEADESAGSSSIAICILAHEMAELSTAYQKLRQAVIKSGDPQLLAKLAEQEGAPVEQIAVLPEVEAADSKPIRDSQKKSVDWYLRQSKHRPEGEGCTHNPTCLRDANHPGPCKLYQSPSSRAARATSHPMRSTSGYGYNDGASEVKRMEDEAWKRIQDIDVHGEDYPGQRREAGNVSHGPNGWNVLDGGDYEGEMEGRGGWGPM